MATATFTWAAWDTTNAWENLADAGNSVSVTYSRDATDVAAKFVQATKAVTQTEFGRKSGTGDTWASIFGIGASDTVTQVQITAWTKKLVSVTKLSSHSVTMGFIDDSGARVTATDSISGVALGTTADGSYVAQSAGSNVNVNAASQAGSTSVRFSLEYTVTTSGGGGSANVDQRFDGVTATITYTPAVTNVNKSDSESASLAELMPGPELGVTEASTAMEVLAQTDFSVVALGSLAESAGFSTPSTDSASAAESSALAVGPIGNDAGTLAESSTQPATVTGKEAAALAESGSITATLSDSDSAILPPGQVNEADLPRDTDAGTLAETASSTATTTSSDAGSLAETPALAVASSDAGTLAETSQVTTGAVAKSDTDTGTETESAAIGVTPTGEALTQSDAGLVVATLPDSDSATLAETSAIVQQGTHPADGDTGTLAEAQSNAAAVSASDAATQADSTLVAATPSAKDAGVLAESGANTASGSGTDTGTTIEASSITASVSSADTAALAEVGTATTPTPTDTESAALVETATLSQAQVGVSAPPSTIGGGGFGAILRRIKERTKDDDLEVIWADLLPKNEPSAAPADDTEIAPAEHAARTALPIPARLRPRVRVRRRHVPVAFEIAGTSWAPDDDLARQVAEDQDLVALLALV